MQVLHSLSYEHLNFANGTKGKATKRAMWSDAVIDYKREMQRLHKQELAFETCVALQLKPTCTGNVKHGCTSVFSYVKQAAEAIWVGKFLLSVLEADLKCCETFSVPEREPGFKTIKTAIGCLRIKLLTN